MGEGLISSLYLFVATRDLVYFNDTSFWNLLALVAQNLIR